MSLPGNVLVWQRVFKWFGKFPNNRWLRLCWLIVAMLAVYGWVLYVPFAQGWLPGLHWLAVGYDTVFPYVGFVFVFGLFFGWWVVAIAVPILLLISLLPSWRRTRRIAIYLTYFSGLWFAAAITLAPALFVSYSYRHVLMVEPWEKTYRTAYIAFRLDDDYGEVMLSDCNRLGWCHQLHRGYTDFYSAQAAQPSYSPDADRMQVRINPEGYVRSRDQQLCPDPSTLGRSCSYDMFE